MRILVLGGLGHMGRVVTENLIQQDPLYQVSIADVSPSSDLPEGLHHFIHVDLNDNYSLESIIQDSVDLLVCTLPSELGYKCIEAAVGEGVNMVDLSFTDADLSVFDQDAKDKGLTIVTDAGVAPGLSNLVAGRAMLSSPDEIKIMVGGMAQNMHAPFSGYTVTWSLDDLMEEYTRPARILVNGEVQIVDALSGVEYIRVLQEGEFYARDAAFEAFYTDGLRSLLVNNGGVPNLSEKTLRWPGHVEEISRYLTYGKHDLKHEMENLCEENAPDMLIMRIDSDDVPVTMVTKSDENMSAMAKTTALSCATFASLVASGTLTKTGILPPEKLADDDDVYKFVLDAMAGYGVTFSIKYPFM